MTRSSCPLCNGRVQARCEATNVNCGWWECKACDAFGDDRRAYQRGDERTNRPPRWLELG